MKILIVFAHPEPQSLNGALLQVIVDELKAEGNEVQVSDLYAMQWKCQVDRADFVDLPNAFPLSVSSASAKATSSSTLTEDVKSEQEKLLWADTVILQFPLWWFTMPAILKGWVDRVYSCGFAYGVGEHSDKRWGNRYGEGRLSGKRAMLIVTVGGWREHYSPRGINGPIDDVLFPINHGILYYPGFDVLPPFIAYRVHRSDETTFCTISEELRQRMRTIAITKPIPYRDQNGGEYEIPSMELRLGIEDTHATGFALHSRIADGEKL
jgi:NAD(P)H dehydrogenase (quinone)